MKNLVRQNATNLPVIAPYAVASGGGVQVGSLFGIASNDAAQNAEVTIVTRGEFTGPKPASQAWTVGAKVYWDNTARNFTVTAGSNLQVGLATKAVDNSAGATTGQLKLTVAP